MEQRSAFRFPTDLDAECRTAGQSWNSRLRNISTGGCMIECADSVPTGSLLRVRLKGLPAIDSAIAWHHRGYAGIRFLAPLSAEVMERLGFDLSQTLRAGSPAALRRAPGSLHGQLVKRTLPLEPSAAVAG